MALFCVCRVEREAFEQRLKERDDAKTRKMAEAKLSKEELADMERRKYKDEEEKMDLLPRLRSADCRHWVLWHMLWSIEPHALVGRST